MEVNTYLREVLCVDELSLTEVILGQNEYSSLRRFFQISWSGSYALRAYITRRASNLNEIFFQEEVASSADAAGLKAIKGSTFLTQNALLAQMRRLTHIYIHTGKFPRLLIVDELIIYGREINALMQTLEDCMLSAWKKELHKAPSDFEAWLLHNTFFSSVDLLIYARNAQPQLLENHLKVRLHTVQVMSASRWRKYTQNVSRVISLNNRVDNTSYAPSYIFNKRGFRKILCTRLRSLQWTSLGTEKNALLYHGSRVTIWQKNAFPQDKECHLHLTIRCYFGANHTVRVIPLPVFGNIAEDALPDLFSGTAAVLKKELSGGAVIALLEDTEELLREVKLQLISCILSIIIMHDCLPKDWDENPAPELLSNGLEKIAQNFGVINEIYPELQTIDREPALREELRNFLYPFLRKNTEALYGAAEPSQNAFKRDVCLKHAEEFFYSIGQQDEEYIQSLQESKGLYNAWTQQTMDTPFDRYLTSFNGVADCSFAAKMAAILPLMDQGIVAMIMNKRGISVKVSEQSKFCRVRQMYRFVPALIEVERYCRRNGDDMPTMAALFGRYLDSSLPGWNYERLFSEFVNELNHYGQLLQDWDIDLIVGLDKPDWLHNVRRVQEWSGRDWGDEWNIINRLSNSQYMYWERMNQEGYKKMAISFCNLESFL